MTVLVLSSTRREGDGIAEYTRQLFRPDRWFAFGTVTVEDLTWRNILAAPFNGADVVHVQHEFFLFDRAVGVTAFVVYAWLRLGAWLTGYKLVTTVHSTYDTDRLHESLAHFGKLSALFPAARWYLRAHLWWVAACSDRVVVLSRSGLGVMELLSKRVTYIRLGVYELELQQWSKPLDWVANGDTVFALFGFAWPNKGYEYAIKSLGRLVQKGRKDMKLLVVSGEAEAKTFPGGGQGGSYLSYLRHLADGLGLRNEVRFTGYLPSDSPEFASVLNRTDCFVFPYLERDFPSGALATALATRKPVLVSDVRCFRDEYDLLFSFPEKNHRALADAMERVADDAQVRENMRESTRINAERYSMDEARAYHAEMYHLL